MCYPLLFALKLCCRQGAGRGGEKADAVVIHGPSHGVFFSSLFSTERRKRIFRIFEYTHGDVFWFLLSRLSQPERARQYLAASPINLLTVGAVQIRGLLIDAEDENVGLSQELLEETHEDLNSLEDCVKR